MASSQFEVRLSRRAEKQLAKIETTQQNRIRVAMRLLAENPVPPKAKKLISQIGYRIRVGGYRILYEIRDSEIVILVFKIAHRREAYKD